MPCPTSLPGRTMLTLLLAVPLAVSACSREPEPDAYGNVEAIEVVVGAEGSGQLLWFTPVEGSRLDDGAVVGMVDTTQLALQREQAGAQRAGSAARVREVARQIDVLEVQRDVARRTLERTQRLFAQQAATAQQLDQAEREYRVLVAQIEAMQAQRQSASREVSATEAQAAQVQERIAESYVRNPHGGTVLAVYARAGEVVQAGQALYKIASLDTVDVRAYVSEPQLTQVRIGQPVQVSVDAGEDTRRVLPGVVTWVSSEAEFTPTPIQTRDERAELVYAIKVRVPNTDGLLKIGMPADVQFTSSATAAR
ncbi:MAG: HlyD family secretion protein [Gemmatimonadaceae bacterium]